MSDKGRQTHHAAISRLNERQREALSQIDNTVLLAGPGSGKTATLVLKVAQLLESIPAPQGIACLTYSTEAAREFEERLSQLGIRGGGRLFTGTVHAFCLAHILRAFAIRLPPNLQYISRSEIASDLEMARAREAGLAAAGVNEPENYWSTKISTYRRIALVDPARSAEFTDERLPIIANAYQNALRAISRIDFDDVVIASMQLVESDEYVRRALAAKYPWFVIDEYQDLGLALHRMIMLFVNERAIKVFAVGDPDQSIYGFAGARPEFLAELSQSVNVRTIRLELNYRCGQNIIDASLHVLQPPEVRAFRSSETTEESRGEIFFHNCPDGVEEQASLVVSQIPALHAQGIAYGEIGVMSKRTADLLVLGERLSQQNIPYKISKAPQYKSTSSTMWVEDMMKWCAGGKLSGMVRFSNLVKTWEHICVTCKNESRKNKDLKKRISFYEALSALSDPQMTVGDWISSLDCALELRALTENIAQHVPLLMRHDIQQLGVMLDSLTTSRQSIEEHTGIARNKVVLQTIHGSKGLEYSAIFVLALENGVLPQWREDGREARRLFYVAITRAKRTVYLLWSGFWHTANGAIRRDGPSPFLTELHERLQQQE